MQKIAIFGAGGFGREVHMLIEQINRHQAQWEFIGYFDDGSMKGTIVNGYEVLGTLADLNAYPERLAIVFALGHPSIKLSVISKIVNSNLFFPVLVHPNVLFGSAEFNDIGEGSIVTAGNIITVNTKIGRHVILNLGCTVGHDSIIEDFCSFMPSVSVSGEVKIQKGVYVGTGAKIINQLEIGENTIIGAGAVVSKSLPANCTAVGIPAKPVKFHTS